MHGMFWELSFNAPVSISSTPAVAEVTILTRCMYYWSFCCFYDVCFPQSPERHLFLIYLCVLLNGNEALINKFPLKLYPGGHDRLFNWQTIYSHARGMDSSNITAIYSLSLFFLKLDDHSTFRVCHHKRHWLLARSYCRIVLSPHSISISASNAPMMRLSS